MHVGDVAIRKTNYITIKYDANEYARLVKISHQTTLSIPKLIALSSQPCPICGNDHVAITIPLGLISAKKQTSGRYNKITNGKQKQDP